MLQSNNRAHGSHDTAEPADPFVITLEEADDGVCRLRRSVATSTPLEAAEPLTDADRAELARRRATAAHWAEVSARQRAAHGMVGW